MPESLVYTVAVVAALLGIGESTVYDRIADGTIRGVRLGPRRIVIPKTEIERLLSAPGGTAVTEA
jgi:excisionase family DNA binding protein